MELTIDERKQDGQEIFYDHLENIGEGLRAFLAALDGFRRDVELSRQSDSPVDIRMENVRRPFVPPAITPESQLSALAEALSRALAVLDGEIRLGDASENRAKAKTELSIIHENLSDVGHAAIRLHDLLQAAERNFDMWNADNGDAYKEANIPFDRDSLNVASAAARAISERAVRLDIGVVEALESLAA